MTLYKTLLLAFALMAMSATCRKTQSGPKAIESESIPKGAFVPVEPAEAYYLNELGERSDVLLHLSETNCLGRCPAYEFVVFQNGKAEYMGRKFAQREGFYTAILPEKTILALRQKASNFNLFSLENYYPLKGKPVADLPNAILYYSDSGRSKRITCNFDTPAALQNYLNWLRLEIEAIEWHR